MVTHAFKCGNSFCLCNGAVGFLIMTCHICHALQIWTRVHGWHKRACAINLTYSSIFRVAAEKPHRAVKLRNQSRRFAMPLPRNLRHRSAKILMCHHVCPGLGISRCVAGAKGDFSRRQLQGVFELSEEHYSTRSGPIQVSIMTPCRRILHINRIFVCFHLLFLRRDPSADKPQSIWLPIY